MVVAVWPMINSPDAAQNKIIMTSIFILRQRRKACLNKAYSSQTRRYEKQAK